MTSAPDGAAELAVMVGVAGGGAVGAALLAQRLQLADPAHVALASAR